ncbi:MAG TPA: CHRD domain-containing protein [Burkholderiales bacterium]|nr:CHRD domain-containing protein [Burkholderiales bacterium]
MNQPRNFLMGLFACTVAALIVSCGGSGGYGSMGGSTNPSYSVGGTVTGATGAVVLKLNGGSDMSVTNGPFTFGTMVVYGGTFNVQVVDANDRCTVANGAGTMGLTNVMNVAITCGAQTTQTVVRSTSLNGAQENPPVTTGASGLGGIIFDPTGTAVTGGVTVFGITPISVGIFQAPTGNPTGNSVNPAIITLTSAGDGHTFFIPAGTSLSAADQITSLLAGELYFNVLTAGHAAGEIRGPINAQGGVLAGVATLNFAQEFQPDLTCTGITTTGAGTVVADQATGTILISYMTHNVANADAAHIHTSTGPASNGGVIIPFVAGATFAYPTVAGAQMTGQNLATFAADSLYFNIHSTMDGCPTGEIRGNIAHIQ